jgi:ariadne-1
MKAKCMQTGCNMIIPHSFFMDILNNSQELQKYKRWMCLSFTEENHMIKWCPNNQCEYGVQKMIDYQIRIVNCKCGQSFCFECSKEMHQPASCDMVKRWETKNSSESENINWILANTKQCPNSKCTRPIEKNQGCNHMQCKMCQKEFCWLCLGDWKEHNSNTGGYYKCNKFKDDETSNK